MNGLGFQQYSTGTCLWVWARGRNLWFTPPNSLGLQFGPIPYTHISIPSIPIFHILHGYRPQFAASALIRIARQFFFEKDFVVAMDCFSQRFWTDTTGSRHHFKHLSHLTGFTAVLRCILSGFWHVSTPILPLFDDLNFLLIHCKHTHFWMSPNVLRIQWHKAGQRRILSSYQNLKLVYYLPAYEYYTPKWYCYEKCVKVKRCKKSV